MNRVFYIIGILPFHRCFFWTSQSENKVKKSVFLPSVCSFLLAVTQQCYQQQDLLCLFWKHSCQPSRGVMDRKPLGLLLALLNSVTLPWTDHLLCGPWMYVLPLGASFPHMQSVSDITSQGWVGTTPAPANAGTHPHHHLHKMENAAPALALPGPGPAHSMGNLPGTFQQTRMQHFPCFGRCPWHFIHPNSFNSCNNPVLLIIVHILQMWGTEKVRELPGVTQPVGGRS